MAPQLTGLTVLVVYILTLSRHVGAFDVAEMQTIPHEFGIAHPTTYPLYTMLGGIWSRIPIGSVALRMNLLSAVLIAAAAAIVVQFGIRLGTHTAIAAASGLLFAFASVTWTDAVRADVQSLHVFLLALLLLRWEIARRHPTDRNIVAMCLVAGIGLTHHGLMLPLAAGLLAAFLVEHFRSFGRSDLVVASVGSIVLPLGVFIYVPLREASAPIVDIDPAASWRKNILGSNLKGSVGTARSFGDWGRNHIDVLLVEHSIGIVALILVGVACVVLVRRNRLLLASLAWLVLVTSYTIATSGGETRRYMAGELLVLAIMAGIGADTIHRYVRERLPEAHRQVTSILLVAMFTVVPLNALRANFKSHDASADKADDTSGRRVLEALPQHCVLWAYWDLRTTLFYLRNIDHVRTDISVLDHRSIAFVGEHPGVGDLYRGLQRDPRTAGRPVCFVPDPQTQTSNHPGFVLNVLTQTRRPYGSIELGPGDVFLVEPSP